jgi:glucose-6-phosphate 1-epimerase
MADADQSPEELQARFGIDGVRFQAGRGGLTQVAVNNQHADAEVYLHGAHVTRWQPRGQKPVLWMSGSSWFEAGKPIRGGIPICWPWFGPHPKDASLPGHGYARLKTWRVRNVAQMPSGETSVALRLSAIPELFPNELTLDYVVLVGKKLDVSLSVTNNGRTPFTYSEALHTYLAISDIHSVRVRGLAGATFVDKMQSGKRVAEQPDPLAITAETDRLYVNTQSRVEVVDPGWSRTIAIDKSGSNSTVVWNPWINKSKAMKDFGDDEWPGMICVETVNAADNAITLQPGDTHETHAIIGLQ